MVDDSLDADLTAPTDTAEFRQSKQPIEACVLVFGGDSVKLYPFPSQGAVTIGRSQEASISVNDPSISRLHASISIVRTGSEISLRIRDLESSNGTKLRGERLEAHRDYDFKHGEVIEVGNMMLVVKQGRVSRPRRRASHDFFELRLEEECARAANARTSFSVIRLRVSGNVRASSIEEALNACLADSDVLGLYAPSEYEILVADKDQQGTLRMVEETSAALTKLGALVRIGHACFPQDGQAASALLARAGPAPTRTDVQLPDRPLIVRDAAMRQIYELVDRVAPSEISVLVLGETGVGKEVLAREIHERSRRASKPFVALNCGAFPEELLETELFGHERGAFTGAVKSKLGLLESAAGGTVLLDEIGEMHLSTQVKLLRVLEERRVRRVGGISDVALDVRLITATNRDLEREIIAGRFRGDLFYRLSSIAITLPPLRKRKSEIAELAHAFAKAYRLREGLAGPALFAPRAMERLCGYEWPGNVRELRNVIERAVVLAQNEEIDLDHLPLEKLCARMIPAPEIEVMTPAVRTVMESETLSNISVDDVRKELERRRDVSLSDEVQSLERERIVDALAQSAGNQTRAAEILGITRKVLIKRIERFGIVRPRASR